MTIDFGSLSFNMIITSGGGTPSWGTALGQNEGHKITFPGYQEFIPSMVYKMVPNMNLVKCPLGKGGNKPQYASSSDYEYVIASNFTKVFVNGKIVENGSFVLLVTKELNNAHSGRLTLKYNPKIEYDGISNVDCYKKIQDTLGITENAAWFVSDIDIKDQEELHFTAFIGDSKKSLSFDSSDERKKFMISLLPEDYNGVISSMKFSGTTWGCQFPLQQILYGAPGTGKSHGVKEKEGEFSKVIRTTFHPDSDYSTFVGAYKPTMASKERIYSADELIGKLTTIKESGVSYPCHKFSAQYWESLKDLPAAEIKRIVTACGFTDSMTVEVGKGVSIGQELASKSDDKKITYSFVKQAFLKAYIEAWKRHDKRENVLLVIEEINRGNCAQIFGDLFQLLDRNDEGYSDYPIQADEDIRMVLADEFVNLENIPENVKSGEELLLPPNLYIWATMNTSDQSLFPIDSAFKRRWDWKYVPIDTKKENWTIKIGDKDYSWSSFLEKINEEIDRTTHSEDKMLGFYFCRANNGVIDADKFVSKVLFYIYNDVFKDYGFDREMFKDEEGKVMSFKSYYKTDGTINERMVLKFLDNLKVEKNTIEDNANNDPNIKTE